MASVVRTLLRPASLLAPLNGSDRIAPAIGDFYIWASGGSVTLPAARYDYNSDWSPLLAGLSPAGIAASLAALVHVSVRPPCHPGRSPLASPVGDHDSPCAIFPGTPWLKRSLAYTPLATGLPRGSIAVCRPCLADTASGMGDTPSTRHDREPLRTRKVLPLG